MIVPRRSGLTVVQHGVEGHLEGDVDLAEVARQKAGSHGEAAPGAFPAHHDLCVVDSQLVGVDLQEEQGGVAVFQVGGERFLEGGAVFRGHHHGAVLLYQEAGVGQEDLLVHAVKMSPSMKPQDAGSVFSRSRVFRGT